MSDLLTHWAVFDDARRLFALDEQAEPLFNGILAESSEFSRLGALTRYGSKWTAHILRGARQNPALDDERWRQKLGFALGGLLHYPADFVFKPMMSRLADADWESTHRLNQRGVATAATPAIREVSAYFDCHVFKKVYLSGHEAPFSRFLLAPNESVPGREAELFARALFQRALLACHTLKPAMGDFDGWLDRLLDEVQPLYLDMELYSRVFEAPDAEKMALYEVETTFYRDSDPIISLAREAARGEVVTGAAIETALQVGENASGYGEAVRLGVLVLREAAQFWRGEIEVPPDVSQG